jgi:hypothetical protein
VAGEEAAPWAAVAAQENPGPGLTIVSRWSLPPRGDNPQVQFNGDVAWSPPPSATNCCGATATCALTSTAFPACGWRSTTSCYIASRLHCSGELPDFLWSLPSAAGEDRASGLKKKPPCRPAWCTTRPTPYRRGGSRRAYLYGPSRKPTRPLACLGAGRMATTLVLRRLKHTPGCPLPGSGHSRPGERLS